MTDQQINAYAEYTAGETAMNPKSIAMAIADGMRRALGMEAPKAAAPKPTCGQCRGKLDEKDLCRNRNCPAAVQPFLVHSGTNVEGRFV